VNVLAIIPARGGSKGVPRKNIRPLAGKPLITHTIEQARHTPAVSRIVVSTDDAEIGSVAQQYGAEIVWRPAEISGDTASSESALLHTVEHLKTTENYSPDLVMFLQCTSPIRQPDDLQRGVEHLLEQKADSLLSVVPFDTFIWQRVDGVGTSLDYDYRKRPRRQDRNQEYIENGSFYVFKPWVLKDLNNRLGGRVALYEMNRFSSFDIDSQDDFELCEAILAYLKHKGTVTSGN
jgi:N-acylneuraminate cytidylyltransferase